MTTGRPPTASVDQKTHFVTRGGLHLLYDQDVLDEWISREVEPLEDGGYRNIQTGELVSQEEVESYERYRQRLCERHPV